MSFIYSEITMQNELFYLLALMRTEGVGDISAKKMLSYFGSAQNIFSASAADLAASKINKKALSYILKKSSFDKAEKEVLFIEKEQIRTYYYQEESYPEKLKHCPDAPVLLFSSGDTDIKNKKILSIVGTRKITGYGSSFCKKLIEDLAVFDPVIISGFALGVDICAHLAAFDNNLKTVGVLAHGLNRIYPPSHKKYVNKIEQNGGFLTEFWSDSIPDKENFVRRNRIVAGISDATIVIESAIKGGSLITANLANDYSREVFAVPGKTTDIYSQGCNHLIKTQRANLLTSAQDLIYMLNWDIVPNKPKVTQKELFVSLDENQQKIYDYLLKNQKEQLDTIAKECNIPVFKVASILFDMELKGIIRPLPGKMFELA